MKNKKLIGIIAINLITSLILLSGCELLPDFSTVEIPIPDGADPAEESYNLAEPDGVALSFLDAWMSGDYAGMYSLLSSNSQAEYTLEDFTNTYETTAATMGLQAVDARPQSVAETTSNAAQFDIAVTYNTVLLGNIEQELTMLLVRNGESWGVAWSPALILPELAGGNTLQLSVERPSRANIYDRSGDWMVSANASVLTLTVVPGEVSTTNEEDMLDMLAEMTRIPREVIRSQYAGQPDDWVVAIGDVDLETFNQYRNLYYSYPGLDAFEKTGRRYYNVLAPHVMGYARQIPAEELEYYLGLGYRGDEVVGISGLEAWGEPYLAGSPSATLSAYTPSGTFFAEVASIPAEPAESLYTTIDREMQAIAQDALREAYIAGEETWVTTASGASVVVMDPNTGAVLALANYPDFDPNVLHPYNGHPLAGSYVTDMFNNPLRPLLNRAAQGQYPAGSIFKIVSMVTALDFDVLGPNWTYNSTGAWNTLGTDRYDWQDGGHGLMTLQQALTASCNTCFYEIGYQTGLQDPSLIAQDARELGLGAQLGIEIEEASGLIPDPEWMLATNDREWNLNDSVNMAIGQGDVLVTPLQMATMVSAIANRGTVYRPYFVDRIGLIGEDPSVQFEPEILNTFELTDDEYDLIHQAMYDVVNDPTIGTAEYRLGSMQVEAAGKTGTAQVSDPNASPIAWFAGFAPYENPEIVVVVMVENGGQGSGVAAPIFRRVLEEWYGVRVAPFPNDWYDPELFDFVDNDGVPGE